MRKFFLRIQTYLKELAGITRGEELPLPQSDIEESLYTMCLNNPGGIVSDKYGFKKVSGSVTPTSDTNMLKINEKYDGLEAISVVCDINEAKAKGVNTMYGAKGVIGTGTVYESGSNLLYYYLNNSLAVGIAGTSADNDDGNISIGVSPTRFFRSGVTYNYVCYYWNDNIE